VGMNPSISPRVRIDCFVLPPFSLFLFLSMPISISLFGGHFHALGITNVIVEFTKSSGVKWQRISSMYDNCILYDDVNPAFESPYSSCVKKVTLAVYG